MLGWHGNFLHSSTVKVVLAWQVPALNCEDCAGMAIFLHSATLQEVAMPAQHVWALLLVRTHVKVSSYAIA
jgi:hypothetical protein